MTEAAVLPDDECDRLLRAGTFGRLAFTTPGGPEIVPVNYRVVADAIVVRTAAGTLLARWAHEAQVTFEVDLVNHERWVGWSVIARGVASIEGPDVQHDPHRGGPRPWADGERGIVVRLPWTTISGRQLGRGWDALASMPARTTSL